MGTTKRKCDNCSKEYLADNRNLKRGWGLCCSKSCSASKREKSKPTYNIETVARNNRIRAGKMTKEDFQNLPLHRQIYFNQMKFGRDVYAPNIVGGSGMIQGFTSEGYRIMDGVAYDEFDDPVYNVDPFDDCHPFDMDY